MLQIEMPAKSDQLNKALNFVSETMRKSGFGVRNIVQTEVAVEALFNNITQYAYGEEGGTVTIRFDMVDDRAHIQFEDSGQPFDPLQKLKETKTSGRRKGGGMGLVMASRLASEMEYEYLDGKNILTIILEKRASDQ